MVMVMVGVVVMVGVGVVVVGEPPVEAGLAAHVVDGLLQQLQPLAARRAGLHGAGEVQLLQQLLQLLLGGQAGPVGRHQKAIHWEGGGKERSKVDIGLNMRLLNTTLLRRLGGALFRSILSR